LANACVRVAAAGGGGMDAIRFLAVLPYIGMLGGVFFFNRVQPLVLGLPLLLAWLVLWVLLTSAVMGIIYVCDPANRRVPEADAQR
jgi:Protein of unknown function (DUF3311)